MTREELIRALEATTGPSRELDAEIALTLNPGSRIRANSRTLETADGYAHIVQPYTASIDAALTLVPEGWWIVAVGEFRTQQVYVGDKHLPTGKWFANLQHEDGGRLIPQLGRTAALALSAAALRARQP